MELRTVRIEKSEALNFILRHSHFIKTVEDLHKALVQAGAHLRLGLAFCESSDPCLIRRSGNDAELVHPRRRERRGHRRGHSFVAFLEAAFRWETTVSTAQLFGVGKPSAATAQAILEVAIAVMRVGLLLRMARGGQKPRFGHAASPWYSWIRPPSRSFRRTSRGLTVIGTSSFARGVARPRARCGRPRL
jgi:adenosine/AMP kinase